MATLDVLLSSQENSDALLADAMGLRTIIKTITDAKKLGSLVGAAEIDDIPEDTYVSHIAGRYVPFVSCMSNYTRQTINLFPGTREQTIEFTLDAGNANFIGDIMLQVDIPKITLDDLEFNPAFPIWPSPGFGRIRYCQYPGVRLFEEVSLIINGVVQETYTWENVVEYMQHEMPEDKRVAFEKCVGQQQMQIGQSSYSFDSEGAPITGGVQTWTMFTNGPQTPKNEQPAITLCVPLMFTTFRDESIPMPNILNVNKRVVRIKTANLENIVSHYVDAPVGTLKSTFRFANITMHTRGIFMNPQLASLFNTRKKTIIRSWKTIRVLSETGGLVKRKLDDLKNPVECMYVRFVPIENQVPARSMLATNIPTYDYYHVAAKVTKLQQRQSSIGVSSGGTMFQNMQVIQTNSLDPIATGVGMLVQETDFYAGRNGSTVGSAYMSFVESSILRQPTGPGSFIINFSQQYKGDRSRTVSGYLDATRLSNKELVWDSTLIGPTNPCYIIISARFINSYEPRDDGTLVYAFQI